MPQGLSVGRLIRVSVNLQPLAAQRRGFGTLLIAGDSDVINGSERIRNYSGENALDSVANDFGLLAPEYQAAALYFSQVPRPQQLQIGRWIRTDTGAILQGSILTAAEQLIANFTGITTGAFDIDIDGVTESVTGLDFSAQTNLNGVAAVINAAMVAASIEWTGSRFIVTANSTGATSELGYAETPGAGQDVSGLLKLTAATALAPIPGYDAETPAEATLALADFSAVWYGLMFAASTMPTPAQVLDVSQLIEGLGLSRIYGVVETDTRVLDATYTADLASVLKDLLRRRTFVQYSANAYAVASFFGRAFSVNFSANRSTITLMYKIEPGVVAETLTESQALTLKDKRCNVFVNYQNDTAIIQYGVMSGLAYFDEVHGLDWFKDALQNAEYNLLYQSKTKIPQTDDGMNQIVNVASSVCEEAVNNGLVAPGQWNADGFGQLERGNYLKSGYYIYAPPMATQPQAIREQRIAPPMQIALKLAGAIHEMDIIVDVNR